MAGRIRLKTKLVFAITAMMVALVSAFASVYLSQLIQHRIADADDGAHFVANQVFNATRQAIPQRETLHSVRGGTLRQRLNVVSGPRSVYEIRVPIERDNSLSTEIRV